MAHGHKIVSCRNCFSVVSQCRCPELNKAREFVDFCESCNRRVLVVNLETPAEQRKRVTEFLSFQVDNFRKLNGDGALALAVFGWLVDARIKIEALKNKLTKQEYTN